MEHLIDYLVYKIKSLCRSKKRLNKSVKTSPSVRPHWSTPPPDGRMFGGSRRYFSCLVYLATHAGEGGKFRQGNFQNNHRTLVQSHLRGDVDEPLVDEEADVLGEEVGDVLQHLPVPALGSLLQQECPAKRKVRNSDVESIQRSKLVFL